MGIHVSGNGPILTSSGYGIEIDPFSSSSGGGEASLSSPAPLLIVPTSTTRIYSSWTGIGGASYVYERAEESDFSDAVDLATEGYNGTDTFFEDTTRAIDTLYYYRLTASLEGYEDVVLTGSASTYSVLPEFDYEATGIARSTNNDYADIVTSNQVSNLKSVINPLGSACTPVSTRGTVILGAATGNGNNDCAYPILSLPATPYNLDTPLVIGADEVFTILVRLAFVGTPNNNRFFIDLTDTTRRIQFSNLTTISVAPSGTLRNITVPAMISRKFYDIVIRRIAGNILQASIDGGVTFASAVTADGGTFRLEQIFCTLNHQLERVAVYKATLTEAQMTQYFNAGKLTAYTPAPLVESTEAVTIKGVTYSPYTAPYITDSELSKDATSSVLRGFRILGIGDKQSFTVSKDFDTYFGQDKEYIYDKTTGQISSPVLLDTFGVNTDLHNTTSKFEYDRKLCFALEYPHYTFYPSPLYFRISGPEFDLSALTLRVARGGVPSSVASNAQYHNITVMSDGRIMDATQSWDGGNGGFITNFVTSDFFNSTIKTTVADTADGTLWFYPITPYNKVGDWHHIIIQQLVDTNNDYQYLYHVKTQDGNTWYNMDESASKDVSGNRPLTPAELQANYMVVDGSAYTGRCQCTSVHIDANGIIHGVCGDGNNGWQYFKWNGTSWDLTVLDFGSYDIVGSDDTEGVVPDTAIWLHPRGGDNIDIYCLEENGGNWQPVRFRSSDAGVTLTYDTSWITGLDTTKKHVRLMGTQNACYTDNVAIMATVRDGSDYAGKILFQPL